MSDFSPKATGQAGAKPTGIGLSTIEMSALDPSGIETFTKQFRRLEEGLSILPDKPEEATLTTLKALWMRANGEMLSTELAAGSTLAPLGQEAEQALEQLIERRLAGEPLAYLTQRQRFFGIEMLAGPGALIPRKETELLAKAADARLLSIFANSDSPLVVDVCTGSGNIALALASRHPAARLFAADLSPDAVSLARMNADLLNLSDSVDFRTGDLLVPFDSEEFLGQIDLLTCNPPYISTKKLEIMPGEIVEHEPALAFDGGPLGIRILQRIIQEAPRYLRHGGWLAFEVGLGQGGPVRKRMESSKLYRQIETVSDSNGDIRVILGMKQR